MDALDPVPEWHIRYYKNSYAMKSKSVIHYADKFGLEWYAAYRWELIRVQCAAAERRELEWT